jgi:hypothetical protein
MNQGQRLSLLAGLALLLLGSTSALADVICDPAILELDEVTDTGIVVIRYTGGGAEDVAGYSLDITWDNTLATAVFERPDNGDFSTALTFLFDTDDPGHVIIDSAIGGVPSGIASGELMKITFTGVASALGTGVIDLTVLALRDDQNQPIVGGDTDVDGFLDVDMVGLPSVENIVFVNNTLTHTDAFVKDGDSVTITAEVTDYDGLTLSDIEANLSGLGGSAAANPDNYSDPLATWDLASVTCTPADGPVNVDIKATDASLNETTNTGTITADNTAPTALENASIAPGHRKIHLSWDDITPRDANPLGVEFRYNTWGDYPTYDNLPPAYPSVHTEGTLALTEETLTAVDWEFLPWDISDRDIYYVTGFVYDMALNYGPTGTTNFGRATNYWLGDVDDTGEVDVATDISQLGDTYGLDENETAAWDPFCNVGPTYSGNPQGIPNPNGDNKVGFEDMMIFALNWSVVTPETKNSVGGTPVLAWRQTDETTWALSLVEKGGDLQGLNLRAELPAGVECSVARGKLLNFQNEPVFLRNLPGRGLDAGLAIFGQGVGFTGTGELVQVTLSEPVENLEVVVTARDAENKDLGVELGQSSPSAVPTVATFAQNYPNPFNPSTTLKFDLPQERKVHLAVYAVDGTKVRTLVDGVRGPGSHEISWDGRDDSGRSVAAGTYFARIDAGDLKQIRKMGLVK